LLTMASFLIAIIHYLSTTTSPLDRRVPVVVRFHNEQIARAVADSFVDAVHVKHGQRVEIGQLLMELSQPELLLQRQSTVDDLELSLQRSTQYRRNGNIALADAKTQEAESLKRQIIELDQQIEGLRVIAAREGRITTPNLQRMIGRYVRQGDELVRVSDPNEKEVLAAVGERDINGYQLAVKRGQLASVRLRGGTQIQAMPSPLRPRARVQLPHPAMSAVVGGPLAVQPSDDPNHPMQLVEPQLESVSKLDPLTSASVAAGQLGVMIISDDRPLISRIYDQLQIDVR
jgi:putative peptide zinc metalloprotease protein